MNHEVTIFIIFYLFVVIQRLVELRIANNNTKKLLNEGGVEYGRGHYWIMIVMHSLFFISLLSEAIFRPLHMSFYWSTFFILIFLAAQVGRVWVIRTLKGRWTTRIIISPSKKLVQEGPFRYLSHPNYVVVAIEILALPLIFGLYWTALIFTILNAIVLLLIRIPEENRALKIGQEIRQS